MKVIVTKCGAGYAACWAGDQNYIGSGSNPEEAIGSLITRNPDKSGIKVYYKEDKPHRKRGIK